MAIFYNSNCSTLGIGCYLYNGPGLTNPVSDGYYSDGSNCYTVTGGNGYISDTSVCQVYYYYFVTQYLDCLQNSGVGQYCVRTTFLMNNWLCGTDTYVYEFASNATQNDWNNSSFQIESTTSLTSCLEACI